jgi:hypothetical protein
MPDFPDFREFPEMWGISRFRPETGKSGNSRNFPFSDIPGQISRNFGKWAIWAGIPGIPGNLGNLADPPN